MDDAASGVEVVEAEEDLLGDLADDVLWHAAVLVALDEAEQVFAEHLEHHADVGAVGTVVSEVVEEGDDMAAAGVVGI